MFETGLHNCQRITFGARRGCIDQALMAWRQFPGFECIRILLDYRFVDYGQFMPTLEVEAAIGISDAAKRSVIEWHLSPSMGQHLLKLGFLIGLDAFYGQPLRAHEAFVKTPRHVKFFGLWCTHSIAQPWLTISD